MKRRAGKFGTVLVVATLVACGDSGGRQKPLEAADITIQVDNQPYNVASGVRVDPGSIPAGQTRTFVVQVFNQGERDLEVLSVTLQYTPASQTEGSEPAFRLGQVPAFPAYVASPNATDSTAPTVLEIPVVFQRYEDDLPRSAVLVIRSNDKDLADQSFQVRFQSESCDPHLGVPPPVDFEQVQVNQVEELPVDLKNTGSCALLIEAFLWKGDPGFTLVAEGVEYPTNETDTFVTFPQPVSIASNSQISWTVRYEPPSGAPAHASLTVYPQNDPTAVGGRTIEVLANTTGPCIEVVPSPVEFGGKLIQSTTSIAARIHSCGTADLVITDIFLRQGEGLSPDFGLDYAQLPGGARPTADAPLTIHPSEFATVGVQYTPDVQNPVDPVTGQPVLDRGVLVIANNSFVPEFEANISGHGVPVECPQPVILVQEGEEVPPQTILHLYGDQSVPSTGAISKYQWSLDQPADNKFNLLPSMSEKNVTHEVNVAGTYTYCLDVCDSLYCSNDLKCKTTACKKVVVIPKEAIHCELTWKTPADPNEYDDGPDAGSDLDLHFIHPYATGPDLDGDGAPDGWFDLSYDCFWYTSTSVLEWGTLNPNISDNPRLDRDDTDGAGPENINLDVPEDGRVYKVGVHYWDDHGFGASYPQVKCYCWGKEAFKKDLYADGIKMFTCDMWEVATISWPDCRITAIQAAEGGPKIVHHYQNPAFVQIGSQDCGQ